MHDSACYKECAPYRQSHRYFSDTQYIVGDSAYELSVRLMRGFTTTQGDIVRELFNRVLNGLRVGVEHAFGLLKSRWMSLKEVPLQLNREADVDRLILWIGACCTLHNFIISIDRIDDNIDFEPDQERGDVAQPDNSDHGTDAQRLRDILAGDLYLTYHNMHHQ